ncbi:MAG: flagellar protein FlgN [Opitutaceae bacterium]|nr:flagellar protein FlgN [Opitutaceae bacterium]
MSLVWQNLADALRAEIAEYGALLHLFSEQQRLLFARDADGVLRLSTEIEGQVAALHDCRHRREQAGVAYARAHGHPAGATLRSLLPSIDAEARPLLEALITEVNRLVHRTRRITRHNQALLARAVETHQELLRILRPGAFSPTYAPNGRVAAAGPRPASSLQAAG